MDEKEDRLFHRVSHFESADALARKLFMEPLLIPQAYGADAGRAHAVSSVFAMYGDYDRASRILAEVDWPNYPPMLQALELDARAIIAYVRRDFALGLQLARRAFAMTEGATAGLRKVTSFSVDVGRALVDGDAQVVQQLEARKPRPGRQLHMPFVYWVLSEVYAQRGDAVTSSTWLARCETALPHARGLLNQSTDARATGTSAQDANPYGTPATTPYLYSVKRKDKLQATLMVIIGWLVCLVIFAMLVL